MRWQKYDISLHSVISDQWPWVWMQIRYFGLVTRWTAWWDLQALQIHFLVIANKTCNMYSGISICGLKNTWHDVWEETHRWKQPGGHVQQRRQIDFICVRAWRGRCSVVHGLQGPSDHNPLCWQGKARPGELLHFRPQRRLHKDWVPEDAEQCADLNRHVQSERPRTVGDWQESLQRWWSRLPENEGRRSVLPMEPIIAKLADARFRLQKLGPEDRAERFRLERYIRRLRKRMAARAAKLEKEICPRRCLVALQTTEGAWVVDQTK